MRFCLSDIAASRLILVRNGRAVGYLAAVDRDGDGRPDSLLHVWVAGHYRRRGIARELVKAARERWPIASIVGPLNPLRTSAKVASAVASGLEIAG